MQNYLLIFWIWFLVLILHREFEFSPVQPIRPIKTRFKPVKPTGLGFCTTLKLDQFSTTLGLDPTLSSLSRTKTLETVNRGVVYPKSSKKIKLGTNEDGRFLLFCLKLSHKATIFLRPQQYYITTLPLI